MTTPACQHCGGATRVHEKPRVADGLYSRYRVKCTACRRVSSVWNSPAVANSGRRMVDPREAKCTKSPI